MRTLNDKRLRSYRKRNDKIRGLGFASYNDYLKSDLWKTIRQRVFVRDEYRCFACRGKATIAHHFSYTLAALEGRSIDALRSLCRHCHEFIEFNSAGGKVSLSDSRKRLSLLCRLKGTKYYVPGQERKRRL